MNRGKLTSEVRSDGTLAIHIKTADGGELWLSRPEIVEFLGVYTQSVIANLREIFKNGELYEDEVTRINDKGTTFYNLDVVLALVFRCKGGYCSSIREWIRDRIRQPLIKNRQPIIISLKCNTLN